MRSIVLLAVLTLAPPVLGAEFTTLLTAADGEPFAGAPTTVRFIDDRYLVFVQNAHGFPAPHNESTRSRSWALDVETLELTPIALQPLYMGAAIGTLSVPPLVDGRYTAYVSDAGNAIDAAVPSAHRGDLVYFADLDTGVHTAISKLPDDTYPEWPSTFREQRFLLEGMAISPDARFVVYWSKLAMTADADADPDVWNLFAYDRTGDTTVLVTETALLPGQSPRPARFLADGRLVANLPMDAGDRVQPIVFATIGAPGVPLFDGFDDGAVLMHVSDDGRYAYVGEQDGTPTVGGLYWRIDMVSGERVALCDDDQISCRPIANTSADGRYVAYLEYNNSERLSDLETGQTIDTQLRFMSVAGDGSAVFGYRDGVYLKRELLTATVEPAVTATTTKEEIDEDEEIDVVTYEIEVTNTSVQPISIEIHPTSTRETGDFVFNEGLNGADDAFVCDYQLGAGHCGLFSLASGATWTGTLRLADVPPSIYRLEIEVESLYHFLADPDAVKASDEVEVEREDEPAPTPTPTPPADSGGGGAVGAWWLLLLPALLRRRKMVGDTGIEPVTPAV